MLVLLLWRMIEKVRIHHNKFNSVQYSYPKFNCRRWFRDRTIQLTFALHPFLLLSHPSAMIAQAQTELKATVQKLTTKFDISVTDTEKSVREAIMQEMAAEKLKEISVLLKKVLCVLYIFLDRTTILTQCWTHSLLEFILSTILINLFRYSAQRMFKLHVQMRGGKQQKKLTPSGNSFLRGRNKPPKTSQSLKSCTLAGRICSDILILLSSYHVTCWFMTAIYSE